ncbi:DedA family protein [Candidatus Micrarchaeota archaeon]|nr:DedA family protein [Candidatus Micrarchaeota archaeon]
MLFEFLVETISAFISSVGYPGVFILMVLESMFTPVPSELVMPFAGFLITEGKFDLVLVSFVGALGGVVGSLVSYYIGRIGGEPLVMKFGKYLFLERSHLELTKRWFSKHGDVTIFICRFIPAVRHVISIPAGVGRMDLKRFIAFTFFGAFIWCLFLTYCGMVLKENWKLISNYTAIIDVFIIVGMIFVIAFFFYSHIKNSGK